MLPLQQSYRKRGFLLATGAVTSYGSGAGVDDGALQKGIVKAYTILTTGQYSGTTAITINSKTDTHSNNCVVDNNTGLMWSRYASASVGPASDGKLPWTTTGAGATAEGIFAYCLAANVALLAGYSDWRVPNVFELINIVDYEAPTPLPNATAFPSFSSTNKWTSTQAPAGIGSAFQFNFSSGAFGAAALTATTLVLLVRG